MIVGRQGPPGGRCTLRAWIFQPDAGLPSGRLRHAVNAGDHAAAAMLRARGLGPVRHFWYMQIDLAGLVEPGPEPEGIDITGIESLNDLSAIHAVLDAAFADHWEHHMEPFDRWAKEQAGSPSYDPTLWLLATAGGQPAGALTGNVRGDRGWVMSQGGGMSGTYIASQSGGCVVIGLPPGWREVRGARWAAVGWQV